MDVIKKIINKLLHIKYKFERTYGKIELVNINSRSAEVSFYMLLSLFPFLLATISIVVFLPTIQLNRYIDMLSDIIPASAFVIVESLIKSIISNRSLKLSITSLVLAIWSMSKAVKSLIRAVNRSYGVNETRSFFKVITISMIFTVMLLVLIIVSMILLIGGEKLGHFIFDLVKLDRYFIYIWNILRYSIGVAVIIVILVALYTITPNTRVRTKDAILGAVFATFLWVVVTYGYSFYVNNFSRYDVIYGSLGGVVVLLTWFYLSSWTILIGSEINARLLYKKRNKTKIKKI